MVTRGDTIADRLTHPHNANVGNFNFRQDAIDFRDYDSRDRRQFSPRKKPMRDRDPEKQKSNQTGMVLQQIPVIRPASDWFLLIWASICHKHPLQRSTRRTSSRARRRARVSGATALFLDDTSYGATAHLAGGCGTQASKARRTRTYSTRVSSMLGVKTLTRTFLKITRRSFCVKCL